MSTNINLLKALSQILFSATHEQLPVTSRGVSHVQTPRSPGARLLQAPGRASCRGLASRPGLGSGPRQESPPGVPAPLCSRLPSSPSSRAADGGSVPGKGTVEQRARGGRAGGGAWRQDPSPSVLPGRSPDTPSSRVCGPSLLYPQRLDG